MYLYLFILKVLKILTVNLSPAAPFPTIINWVTKIIWWFMNKWILTSKILNKNFIFPLTIAHISTCLVSSPCFSHLIFLQTSFCSLFYSLHFTFLCFSHLLRPLHWHYKYSLAKGDLLFISMLYYFLSWKIQWANVLVHEYSVTRET